MSKYAQEMPYWGTTVAPEKSRAEIDKLLRKHGTRVVQITTGRMDGKEAWRITFEHKDKPYQLDFHPLEVKTSFGREPTSKQSEQALCQMGRFAFFAIKNLVVIAEQLPAALFGFMAIPDEKGQTRIAADLGVEGLINLDKAITFDPDSDSTRFSTKPDGEIVNG